MVDALDECESEDDIRVILQLLAQARSITTINFRVFVTSRPETPIRLGFHHMTATPHKDYVFHEIPPSIVNRDIAIFLRHKLAETKHERAIKDPWPEDIAIEELVSKAAGLFIHAATTCRFIQDLDFDPKDQLNQIIQGAALSPTSTKELDEMYMQILRLSILGRRDKLKHPELLERFVEIVGAIVILSDALPIRSLARLLSVEEHKVQSMVGMLRSVLNVPDHQDQPVRVFHPSFPEFLLD